MPRQQSQISDTAATEQDNGMAKLVFCDDDVLVQMMIA
jgi:hypothetical protein